MKFVKNVLLEEIPNFFTNYEEKREEGENDSYICSLIRQDSAIEFISHVNRNNISPSSLITPSIFETNPFLIDNGKEISLIEYSAFFGSIQIFQYLLMNKAELKSSLWLYSIHSKNAELIHLLEENNVSCPLHYEKIWFESVKCHHNDIANYIENNIVYSERKKSEKNGLSRFIKLRAGKGENIIQKSIEYHNYTYIEFKEIVLDEYFYYLCLYHYDKLVELLLKENRVEKRVTLTTYMSYFADKKEIDVIYYYLLKKNEIPENFLGQAKIPVFSIVLQKCAF